jgi:hypothetical protein
MVSLNLFEAERTKAFQVAWSAAPSKMASMMSTGKALPFKEVKSGGNLLQPRVARGPKPPSRTPIALWLAGFLAAETSKPEHK